MGFRKFARSMRDTPVVLSVLVGCARAFQQIGMVISENVYRHLPYRGAVTVELPNGNEFVMQAMGGALENGLYWGGIFAHEPESMRLWLKYAVKAECVLDIGANSGLFALAALASGARDVHAFEPLARVHEILESNLRMNSYKKAHAWPLAVGSESGTAELFDPGVGDDAPTSASLSVQFATEHFGDLPSTTVGVISIDDFCNQKGIHSVSLIKLDVEGFEEDALRGMRETLLRYKPVVLMEVLPEYEVKMKAVVRELLGNDYRWQVIREGGGGPDRNVLLTPVDL